MTDHIPALIRAWSTWQPSAPPFLLPEDLEHLESGRDYCTLRTWQDVVTDLGEHREPDYRFHAGLLPQPYMGDLTNARVVILLLNPGCDPCDYHAELHVRGIRSRLLTGLRQDFDGSEYPFHFLDPSLAWHAGYRWWHGKLRTVIAALASKWKCSHAVARRHVAQRIAALQFVPYHSCDFRSGAWTPSSLPSCELAVSYFRDVIMPRARMDDVGVVITRKAEDWIAESESAGLPNVVRYERSHARGAHLSMNTAGGGLIWERLVGDPPPTACR